MENTWILQTLADIADFAQANSLPHTHSYISDVLPLIAAEVGGGRSQKKLVAHLSANNTFDKHFE